MPEARRIFSHQGIELISYRDFAASDPASRQSSECLS
jgi:hypothetical protein